MNDFYDRPQLYDIIHAPGTAGEVDGLTRLFRRFVPRAPRDPVWLEPFCGTGRYLRVAAGRGIGGIGVDGHAGMIRYARQRARRHRNGKLRRGLLRYRVGRAESLGDVVARNTVDFAFNPINSIRHLETDAAMLAHLRGVAGCLKRGGIYAVGLDFARYGRDAVEEDIWEGRRGRLQVTQVCQYLPASRSERLETVVSHVACARPSGVEHFDFSYSLRTYDRKEWRAIVDASPFRLETVVDGSGEDMDPDVFDYGIQVLRRG